MYLSLCLLIYKNSYSTLIKKVVETLIIMILMYITGTVRDLDFSLYNSIPYNNPTNVNRTAPTSRSKQRATVMDIFPVSLLFLCFVDF